MHQDDNTNHHLKPVRSYSLEMSCSRAWNVFLRSTAPLATLANGRPLGATHHCQLFPQLRGLEYVTIVLLDRRPNLIRQARGVILSLQCLDRLNQQKRHRPLLTTNPRTLDVLAVTQLSRVHLDLAQQHNKVIGAALVLPEMRHGRVWMARPQVLGAEFDFRRGDRVEETGIFLGEGRALDDELVVRIDVMVELDTHGWVERVVLLIALVFWRECDPRTAFRASHAWVRIAPGSEHISRSLG